MSRPELYSPPSRNQQKNTILSMEKAEKILLFNERWGWWSRNKKAENIGKVNEVKHCRLLQRQNNFAVTFLAPAKILSNKKSEGPDFLLRPSYLLTLSFALWVLKWFDPRWWPVPGEGSDPSLPTRAQFRHHNRWKEWDPDFLTDREDPLFWEVDIRPKIIHDPSASQSILL